MHTGKFRRPLKVFNQISSISDGRPRLIMLGYVCYKTNYKFCLKNVQNVLSSVFITEYSKCPL